MEQHIHDVVHGLKGFELSVLTSSRTRRLVVEDDQGVRVIRAPEYARPTSTPITPAWIKLLRESGADLLHFHMPNPFGELAFLTSRARMPMVATYHADITGRAALVPAFRPFQQRFLGRAAKIIVGSPNLLESSPTLKPHRDRTVVIPFGVNPDHWADRPALADELRNQFSGPLLIYLGRLARYKGLEILVEAMKTVDATLLLVGGGPKREELEESAIRHSVGEKVVFVGEVEDHARAAYYHAGDLFVLPSTDRAEAFGASMLQAMACGTPAVSTELGTGTSWVNLHRRTGLVVQPNDVTGLAGAINALLANEEQRSEMGKAAIRRVNERFTQAGMLSSLARLYSSLEASTK